MEKFSCILIDANNLYHRIYHGITGNSSVVFTEAELYPKVIKGFLMSLNKIERELLGLGGKMYLLFDNNDSKINLRSQLSDDYKNNRKSKPDVFYRFIELLKNILLVYKDNYNIVYIEQLEADDIVKPLVDVLSSDDSILLYSSDLDWARCIDYEDRRVFWYNASSKIIYDKQMFKDKYGYWPTINNIVLYKSIRGDASDNIKPALKYLREDVVLKILETFTDVQDLIFNYPKGKDFLNDLAIKKIKANERELKINASLVGFMDLESIGSKIDNHLYECKFKESALKLYYANTGIDYSFDKRYSRYQDITKSLFQPIKLPRRK